MLALAACVEVAAPAAGGPSEAREQPTRPARTLRIVCERDRSTVLEQRAVIARRDGVHVIVDNRSRASAHIDYLGIEARAGGVTSHVVSAAPGRVAVTCWPVSPQQESEPSTPHVTVLDPRGWWTPIALECAPDSGPMDESITWAPDTPGERGNPAALYRRRADWLRKGDVVKVGGYPAAAEPVVVVIRDGRTIVQAQYMRAPRGDGVLLDSTYACVDAGIYG